MISDGFPRFADYNMTETNEVQQEVQHSTEILRQCIFPPFVTLMLIRLVEGLLGNQVRKGSHPRRTFLASILG